MFQSVEIIDEEEDADVKPGLMTQHLSGFESGVKTTDVEVEAGVNNTLIRVGTKRNASKNVTCGKPKRGRQSTHASTKRELEVGIAPDSEETSCLFCRRHKTHSLFTGDAVFHDAEGIKAHHLCMLFSAALTQDGGTDSLGGFPKAEVRKELRRISRLKCSHCGQTGAGMGCAVKKCRKNFHYPCGVDAKALLEYYGEYRCFCEDHRQKITFGKQYLEEEACISCLEQVHVKRLPDQKGLYEAVDPFSIVKMKCCKKALMHRDCLLSMALSFGYHFKCPFCNNDDKKARKRFQMSMRARGIFVPKRDSTWEREPNAFGEQLHRPTVCSAEDCLFVGCDTPRLRHCAPQLELCGLCGARGMHLTCIPQEEPGWICDPCQGKMTPPQLRARHARFAATSEKDRHGEAGTPSGRDRRSDRRPLLSEPVPESFESPTRRSAQHSSARDQENLPLGLSTPTRVKREVVSPREPREEASSKAGAGRPLLLRLMEEKFADRTTGIIPKFKSSGDHGPFRSRWTSLLRRS